MANSYFGRNVVDTQNPGLFWQLFYQFPHAFEGGRPSPFPGAIMNVPSRVGKSRDNLLQRQKKSLKEQMN